MSDMSKLCSTNAPDAKSINVRSCTITRTSSENKALTLWLFQEYWQPFVKIFLRKFLFGWNGSINQIWLHTFASTFVTGKDFLYRLPKKIMTFQMPFWQLVVHSKTFNIAKILKGWPLIAVWSWNISQSNKISLFLSEGLLMSFSSFSSFNQETYKATFFMVSSFLILVPVLGESDILKVKPIAMRTLHIFFLRWL